MRNFSLYIYSLILNNSKKVSGAYIYSLQGWHIPPRAKIILLKVY